MESFPGQNLQALQIDFVALVETDVLLGKVIAYHADELDRREETRRDGRMAGRATAPLMPYEFSEEPF